MSACVFVVFLGDSCILPVCSGLPFKHPFSNISLCFCLSKKNNSFSISLCLGRFEEKF